MSRPRFLRAFHEFMTDDSGRFAIVMGTLYAFTGAFVAGLAVAQRDWLYALLMLAIAAAAYRWATVNIALRELRRMRAIIRGDEQE